MTDPRKLPSTIADGDSAALGAKADAAASDSTSSWSLIAIAKGILSKLSGTIVVSGYAADGATPTNPSVLVGFKSRSGLKRTVSGDDNGVAYSRNMLIDTTGAYVFSPDYCSCVIAYNSDSTINTITYTDPISSYVFRRTYSYTNGQNTGWTGWVKQ